MKKLFWVVLMLVAAMPVLIHSESKWDGEKEAQGIAQFKEGAVEKFLNDWDFLVPLEDSLLPYGIIKKDAEYFIYDTSEVDSAGFLEPIIFKNILIPKTLKKVERAWFVQMKKRADSEEWLTDKKGNRFEGIYWQGILPKNLMLVGKYRSSDSSAIINFKEAGENNNPIIFFAILLILSSILILLSVISKNDLLEIIAVILGILAISVISMAFRANIINQYPLILSATVILIIIEAIFLKKAVVITAVGTALCYSVLVIYLATNFLPFLITLAFTALFFVTGFIKSKEATGH